MTAKQVKAPDPDLRVVAKYVNEQAAFLQNLYWRWQDEKEFEDIADYQRALQTKMPDGFHITKMTKRPWGCQFDYNGKGFSVTVNSTSLTYKLIRK